MKRILLLLIFSQFMISSFCQNATDLFISEYCEYNQTVTTPQYFNHYIEIYNGTGHSVDLTKYQLWRSYNATGWNLNGGVSPAVAVIPLTLKGTLDNNKTYVITRPNTGSAPISIAADSAQSWSFLNISGDDAIGLAKDNGTGTFELIDLIGSPTIDPGEYWSVAGVASATQNHTMVRKASVCGPNTNWATSAGTDAATSEWTVLAQNDISNINKHTCNCSGTVTPPAPVVKGKKFTSFFIGNSYTYYNDLPTLINSVANSVGDTLIHDQSTPGGYWLSQHYVLDATMIPLKAKSYDYVVVQEQSQQTSLDIATVEATTFHYATAFDSIRRVFSPSGQTMLYMTWGKKNGDPDLCPNYPIDCTFPGMDSLISLRYLTIQKRLNALIAPVGTVRKYLRKTHPEIELYIADEKHPTAEGSYVSAVTFYAAMFQKDPAKTTYDFTLSPANAKIIRDAAKLLVYDSLAKWNNYAKGATDSINISITSPLSTDTIVMSKTFNVLTSITAKSDTIKEVTFYLNGLSKGKITVAPYSMNMSSTVLGYNSLIVKTTNLKGNINAKRIDFYVKSSPLAIKNIDSEKLCKVYPNPVTDKLCIDLNASVQNSDIQISDMIGHSYKQTQIHAGSNIIPMDHLSAGVYLVTIKIDENTLVKKMIKN